MELLTWDRIDGNLGNPYWNEIFPMDENLRKSLFWRTWEFQDWSNLQNCGIKKGTITKISGSYIVENSTWDCHWEETLIPAILSLKSGATKLAEEGWSRFCKEYLFKSLKKREMVGRKSL
ncbi:hypothetical protein O181_096728 [Austropuccinia psidii MF-1]|uniref:Uncharacterized protein n=1 Tax=Austropuccinia psidii MF-1 TaxID=1389203 RepID=A0A9Q3PCG6_9BASI|nr:hypothetical protein [Austropuccinia psidii MF-1]